MLQSSCIALQNDLKWVAQVSPDCIHINSLHLKQYATLHIWNISNEINILEEIY